VQIDNMCEKCQLRPGHPWDGTGGFTCLCGPCKFEVTFSGARGVERGVRMEQSLTEATGTRVTIEFRFDPPSLVGKPLGDEVN
jgi:hypothetical protein